MTLSAAFIDTRVHSAQAMRTADAGLLSLALMDARSRTLGWLAAFDGLRFNAAPAQADPPWWLAGQAGWFQEHWITCNVQRGRGAAASAAGLRYSSVERRADGWFSPLSCTRSQRWQQTPPEPAELQDYLAHTLDITLALLDKTGPGDDALYFFRLALHFEDRLGEALAGLVQALDLPTERYPALIDSGLWPSLPSRSRRDALGLPGQTVHLGAPPGGFVPDAEQGAQRQAVAEFEIDAQPVTWSQFAEFVDDGGYDQRAGWTDAGWQWLQATGRRAPRHVEQIGHTGNGVLARRQGRLQRLPLAQAVLHVSAHEANAWCGWAGRRLPSEAEWALAAGSASARGFVWGEMLEWVAAPAALWAGSQAGPAALDALPAPGLALGPAAGWRVLRGASAWASSRLHHPQARRFAAPDRDDLFVGFRSCAV